MTDPLCILIVDDEKNIRKTLGMILEPEGFETVEAESAEEGLATFTNEGADLVILDATMHLPDEPRDARAEFAAGMEGAKMFWRELPMLHERDGECVAKGQGHRG